MSAQKSQKSKNRSRSSNRPPEVLVFAEDKHDSDAIKCLLEAINPRLASEVRVLVQRDPASLTRNALPDKVRTWFENVQTAVVAREKVAEVLAVVVHQDADAADGDNHRELGAALKRHVSVSGYPVVPVQEMEAWWFLFPDSFRAAKKTAWRDVKMPNKTNVEVLVDPKEDLIRRTRKVAPKHVYTEADSLAVASQIAKAIADGTSPANTSKSWDRFCQTAVKLISEPAQPGSTRTS